MATPAKSQQYTAVRVLGQGSFGKVWLVIHKKERCHYVLKVIDTSGMPAKEREATRNEVDLLKRLNHPNVVGFKEAFTRTSNKGGRRHDQLCIVMDYCDGGDLNDRLSARVKERRGGFSEDVLMQWVVQMLLGLGFLHSKHILHRDIKSLNMFLLGNGRLVLGDLGVSKALDSKNQLAHTQIGTPYNMSPELFKNKPYSYASDVWALGCVVFELAALRRPFDASSLGGLALKVISSAPVAMPRTVSKGVQDLVKDMLQKDPSRRPSVPQLLRRPFVVKHVARFVADIMDRETGRVSDGTAVVQSAIAQAVGLPSIAHVAGDKAVQALLHQLRDLRLDGVVAKTLGVSSEALAGASSVAKEAPSTPKKSSSSSSSSSSSPRTPSSALPKLSAAARDGGVSKAAACHSPKPAGAEAVAAARRGAADTARTPKVLSPRNRGSPHAGGGRTPRSPRPAPRGENKAPAALPSVDRGKANAAKAAKEAERAVARAEERRRAAARALHRLQEEKRIMAARRGAKRGAGHVPSTPSAPALVASPSARRMRPAAVASPSPSSPAMRHGGRKSVAGAGAAAKAARAAGGRAVPLRPRRRSSFSDVEQLFFKNKADAAAAASSSSSAAAAAAAADAAAPPAVPTTPSPSAPTAGAGAGGHKADADMVRDLPAVRAPRNRRRSSFGEVEGAVLRMVAMGHAAKPSTPKPAPAAGGAGRETPRRPAARPTVESPRPTPRGGRKVGRPGAAAVAGGVSAAAGARPAVRGSGVGPRPSPRKPTPAASSPRRLSPRAPARGSPRPSPRPSMRGAHRRNESGVSLPSQVGDALSGTLGSTHSDAVRRRESQLQNQLEVAERQVHRLRRRSQLLLEAAAAGAKAAAAPADAARKPSPAVASPSAAALRRMVR